MPIEYVIEARGQRERRFRIDVERGPPATAGRSLPVWTELAAAPCPGCPLVGTGHTHCPAAVDLAPIVEAFDGMASYAAVHARVVTPEREVHKDTDLQEALRSLVGLVMSTSACPVLSGFKPMGRVHLPFATVDETLFRAVAVELVRGLLRARDGRTEPFDLQGLHAFYERIAAVNRAFAERLRSAVGGDAHVNGVVQLFTLGLCVQDELAERLESLRALVGA